MSSRKSRVQEAANLIRAFKSDPDAIITARIGYSKAFISGLRSNIESGRFREEDAN